MASRFEKFAQFSTIIVCVLSFACSTASAQDVALTFDDLPVRGDPGSIEDATRLTDDLIRGLVRNRIPATGFVNEGQLDRGDGAGQVGLLQRWIDAGMDLGNHGYSHLSLNQTPADAYIADVDRGQVATNALLRASGRRMRWFRHPYLQTGTSPQVRKQVEDWLHTNGYKIAPVTMENSDWKFSDRYDDAISKHNTAAAEKIRALYIDYTSNIIECCQDAGESILGRPPAFVFLLHTTRLNATSIDALVVILKQHHLSAVTLDEAMKDPAYDIEDTYIGPDGIGWITRWSLTLKKELPWKKLPTKELEELENMNV
jgi:peptidoglycan/xylan/chitin deacetylase (PgdA/CDA1 family)